MWLPPAISFNFTAPDWLDAQLPRSDAGHLVRRCAAPPIAAEVRLDVFCAYHAYDGAEFLANGCIPKLDIINLHYLDLFVMS